MAVELHIGAFVTTSASYRAHADAREGPLRPGRFGVVYKLETDKLCIQVWMCLNAPGGLAGLLLGPLALDAASTCTPVCLL